MTYKGKKVKQAIMEEYKVSYSAYKTQCPNCKTYLEGGFSRSQIIVVCSHCKKPMELIWEK